MASISLTNLSRDITEIYDKIDNLTQENIQNITSLFAITSDKTLMRLYPINIKSYQKLPKAIKIEPITYSSIVKSMTIRSEIEYKDEEEFIAIPIMQLITIKRELKELNEIKDKIYLQFGIRVYVDKRIMQLRLVQQYLYVQLYDQEYQQILFDNFTTSEINELNNEIKTYHDSRIKLVISLIHKKNIVDILEGQIKENMIQEIKLLETIVNNNLLI